MTFWFVFLLIVFGAFKVLVSSMPTTTIDAIIKKFELHPTLNADDVTILLNGKRIDEEKKREILTHFNEGIFLERHYFPLNSSGIPIVIETNHTKKKITYSIYSYDEYVDVFKTYKKKVITYRMRSKYFQTHYSQ